MQELLFPELSETTTDPFDGFTVHRADQTKARDDVFVCLFTKQDANGKKIYLVGERHIRTLPGGKKRLELRNVKEYKHSRDRANYDYSERKTSLGR